MIVRLTRPVAGPWGPGQKGDMIDIDKDVARHLLAEGHAEHPWTDKPVEPIVTPIDEDK